ncbi:MAG: hypothetical protein ACRDKW_05680, partial [Actinomycetota bacterium]
MAVPVEQIEQVVDDRFGDRAGARPLLVDGPPNAPGGYPRFSHTCGLYWGGNRPEESVRALLAAASAAHPECSLSVVGDRSLEAVAGPPCDGARGDPVARLAAGSADLTFLPGAWSGAGAGTGDPDALDGCLVAERYHSHGSASTSEPSCGPRAGHPVDGVTVVCLHDLARMSGRDLVRLLGAHDSLVVGSRVLRRCT